MSKIKNAFKNKKAFIPFISCGYPDLETTADLVRALADNGADLIELGIPFSDPTAEGPVIMEASMQALARGATIDRIFDMVSQLRRDVRVPMVFMTYANLVFSYGIDAFAKSSEQLSMDGLILPDVPFEGKEEFAPSFRKYGLDFISLIAPSSRERIRLIASQSEGFLYCVSSLGVTGTRDNITTDIKGMVNMVRMSNPYIPCAIGFGISNPDQARQLCQYADGVIVGSALMKLIRDHGRAAIPHIVDLARQIKKSINERTRDFHP